MTGAGVDPTDAPAGEPATDAFYLPEGDRFASSEWTRGPWGRDAQHGGPPAALLGRAVELLEPTAGMRVARFTLEVLRPIPIRPLRVEARVVRPGRRVQLAEATLRDEDGEVARASAWRFRVSEQPVPNRPDPDAPFSLPDPEALPTTPTPPLWRGRSYFGGIEGRFVRGGFFEPGPAAAWMRMRIPLVPGEEPSPLARVLIVADSGNGLSSVLRFDRYQFSNVDLTVHLLRPPEGEWVCVDATTRVDPGGIGLAESTLWDRRGRIGSAAQTLPIVPR